MTIQEQLVVMNDTFKKLHDDFIRLDQEKTAMESRYESMAEKIRSKWEDERKRCREQKEDILTYYRIAQDNSRKLLAQNAPARKPDLDRLNHMLSGIITFEREDVVAGQVIDLCSSYVAYVENDIRKVDGSERNELQALAEKKKNEAALVVQKKKQILDQCSRYLKGEMVESLVRLFENIHQDYEITAAYFTRFGQQAKRKRMMLIGFSRYPVDVPQMLCATLKSSLGQHFDENTKQVNCPCGFITDSSQEISVEYTDHNESRMKAGIQAMILNFLRYFPPGEYKVSVFDFIYYNGDVLGPLSVFASMKNSFVDPVPCNEKSLKQAAAGLADYYRKTEAKLGTLTVYEYNRQHRAQERIPLRILIINRQQEVFGTSGDGELSYIINNGARFGIILVSMTKSTDGGSKGKDREKKFSQKARDSIHIISDEKGGFFLENQKQWIGFEWLSSPSVLPGEFVAGIEKAVKPVEKGTKYFNRFKPALPERSKGKRKPVIIPFAVNEDDKVVTCSFENELFAAYMMGAARSGKSTLLHTMISGLIMNYHPDEMELWLLDFKMLEFKKYVDHRPPHVKYLLLEKSEDLVFDIIDQLERLLAEREYTFSRNGWQKLSDVPVSVYMPVIFVIIDEFAQMSQIMKETKGSGYGTDYTLKLTNLLQKGAAMGFKFIFASQTYTDGVEGLTDPARKQIQQRFALKNTYQEIKDTLDLSGDIPPSLQNHMHSLPPFESLFKWRDDDGRLRVDRLRNMYTEGDQVDRLVDMICDNMSVSSDGSQEDSRVYVDKHPILIDGGEPKTFRSQIPYYKAYERGGILDDLDEEDILIYAGVPCSFNLARPFVMINGTSENILVAGGDRENELSVILSVFNSCKKKDLDIKIWANTRNSMYRKYKNTVLGRYDTETELDEICGEITRIRKAIQSKKYDNRLILVLGYEKMAADMEILGSDMEEDEEEISTPAMEEPEDMSSVMERVAAVKDIGEKRKILEEYNARVAQYEAMKQSGGGSEKSGPVYDAREDMKWILKRASAYGIHFLFAFEQARDFLDTRIDENSFRHKLLFSMSRDDSASIMGSRKANEIDKGVCVYSDGKDTFTMHPHIYFGVPCNGWQVDEQGTVTPRKEDHG